MANVQTAELNPSLTEVDATLSPEQFIESEYESGLDQKKGVLSRLMESRFSRPLLYASTLATTLAFAGSAGSKSSEKKASSEIIGPQVYLVCAYPSDAETCDVNAVKKIGEDMQAWLGNPQKGAAGWSVRLSPNMPIVRFDADSSTIVSKAQISYKSNPNAPGNLQDYLKEQVQSKITPNDPNSQYLTVLTNVAGLNGKKVGCNPARIWNGMNTPGNRNVLGWYSISDCNRENYPAISLLADFFHNERFLEPCHFAFIGSPRDDRGFSDEVNNLLNPNITNSWKNVKVGTWGKSTPTCVGADVNPRTAWLVNASTSGKGLIEYYTNGSPIELDPGNRLQAGNKVEARYKRTANEEFEGWSGDCQGTSPCEFLVDEVIDLQANVRTQTTTTQTTPKNEVLLRARAIGHPSGRISLGTFNKKGKLNFRNGTRAIKYIGKKGEIVAIKEYTTKPRTIDGKELGVKAETGCEQPRNIPKIYRKLANICWKLLDQKNPGNNKRVEEAIIKYAAFPKPIK